MTQLSFEDWEPNPPAEDDAAGGPDAPRRVFLGWEGPPLLAAARWLVSEHGTDLGDWIVALPGAHAARRLQELLAREAPPGWTPPRILTQGALTDELVLLDQPTAGRLVRTLAWEKALRELSPEEAERLARRPAGERPAAEGRRERLRLAETVRSLFGELAPEGVDFADVGRGQARPEIESEALRWEALARAQRAYRSLLERHGLRDPHDARRRAIREGRVEAHARVLLVGIADMNELLARCLARKSRDVTVLVVAPHTEADAFDELGRLIPARWRERDLPLALDDWYVREKPVDQADAALEAIAGWDGRFAPHEVRIGVADEEVVPYLERRLEAGGAAARHAAGTPLVRSRPYRLLRGVVRYLSRGGFGELAALARDVDLTEALGGDPAVADRLDRYHQEHLPKSGRGGWVDPDQGGRHVQAVRRVQEGIDRLLGALVEDEPRALPDWARPLRAFLVRVYGRALDPEVENERQLALALQAFGDVLGELEEVPRGLGAEDVDAATALELVLRTVRAERIPPRPLHAGERAVELFGWLDLALDHAPALVVTGFNEGRIPRSTEGHAFLPDSLRGRLGLPGDTDRLARDVYAATVLLHGKQRIAFVSGRRTTDGDPLVPSRLAFQRPADEVTARVRHFLGAEEHTPPAALVEEAEEDFSCPRLATWEPPQRMSVSSFRTYLSSPYHFFLKHVLRLDSLDDRARELDPLRFGILTHDVLQTFGEEGPHDSDDEDVIEEFLHARVEQEVARLFGDPPLPAVLLQRKQLEFRLSLFAAKQARRRKEGWRIRHVEWSPEPGAAALDVDGEPMELRGQIDRIDVNDETGEWAILDYKTGESPKDPDKAHRRGGEWVDLQLPLYRYLAGALGLEGEPRLGYVRLGKDGGAIDFCEASWSAQECENALERAREVVRDVRAGKLWDRGATPYGEILQAIWGEGMVGVAEGAEGEA